MRFLKIILSVFALFYRLTPNYLIISDVYFLRGQVASGHPKNEHFYNCIQATYLGGFLSLNTFHL